MRSWRDLHGDEDGASMVFAAITMLTVSVSIMFVFQVSLVSTDKIQMQNAADAAAYSGALVEANSLNAIGQVNDAMAYLHYTLLRYTVDSIVYRTLEEYTQHQTWARKQRPPTLNQALVWLALDPQQAGKQPPSVPDEVMLGDASLWKQHIDRVKNTEKLIAPGKQWLQDLHDVERLIVAATPRLVREAVIDMAKRNGATHVAVSGDLDKAWRIGKADSGAGFVELSKGDGGVGDDKPAPQSVWRYALEKLEVDGEPRDYPSWFDPFEGTNAKTYSQARVCWDAVDWAHDMRPSGHMLSDFGEPYMGNGRAPNGHWHFRHVHYLWYLDPVSDVPILNIPGLHNGQGGGMQASIPQEAPAAEQDGGGHFMDDVKLHSDPVQDPMYQAPNTHFHMPQVSQFAKVDHAVVRCPTCWGHTRKDLVTYGTQYGAVVVNSDRQVSRFTHNPKQTDYFELDFGGQMPRPLGITSAMLRSGLTVTVHRPALGLTDILPASPWGTVAVASAQIGLIQGDDPTGGPVLLLEKLNETATYKVDGEDEGGMPNSDLSFKLQERPSGEPPKFEQGQKNYRNLYYHTDLAKGLRFGARLVPVARPYTWHPDLEGGKGLDAMIGESVDGDVWYTTDDAANPTSEKPPIDGLHEFLSVDGPKSLEEAIWH